VTAARVGPVLIDGETGRAVAAAIVRANDQAVVTQRGGYMRVTAPSPCVVTRAGVEDELRGDLEAAMTSFQGRLQLEDEVARWL
jgi:hypothetical protein